MCSALRINWEPLSFTNLAMYFRWGCAMGGSRLKLWWEGQDWNFEARRCSSCWELTQTKPFWWFRHHITQSTNAPLATAPWNEIRLKHHYETRRRFNGKGLIFIFSTTCIRIPLIDTTCNHNYPDSVETFSISSASESCWKLRWILCNLPNSPGVMYSWRSVWGSFLCANRAANTLATSEKFSHFSEHKDCRPRRGFSRLIKHSHICERAVNDTSSDILNDFTSFFISCISWQRRGAKWPRQAGIEAYVESGKFCWRPMLACTHSWTIIRYYKAITRHDRWKGKEGKILWREPCHIYRNVVLLLCSLALGRRCRGGKKKWGKNPFCLCKHRTERRKA